MPELAGLGVRWPLGGMGFDSGATYERRDTMGGLLSGTSGFSGLPGALLRVGAMVDEREQEAAQNKARADQQAAQLKQQANIGLLQLYAGRMSDKTNPRAEQYKWYVAARDLAQRMGDNTFPDIKEDEWNPKFAKFVVRAAEIYAKPVPRAERRRLLSEYRGEIAQENPQAALYLQRQEDYLTAEHETEINKWAVREYRILTDAHDLTEAEVNLRHAARAWANHIDIKDDEDTRNLKTESAIILMAAQRRALEWRDAELKRRKDVTVQPAAGTSVYEITPSGAKLLVPGVPEGPPLSQPLKDQLSAGGFDVRTLDVTNPKDAAIITQARVNLDTAARNKAVEDARALISVEVEKKRQLAGVTSPEVAEGTITGLRNSFAAASKTFIDVRDAYERVQASAKEPSAAGDLSLIFNYMRVLDPSSTVREGEFAQAASAGGFGERLQGLVQRAMTGQRLTDAVRTDFVDRTKKLFEAQLRSHTQLEDEYRRIAKERGVEASNVIIDYRPARGEKGTTTATASAPPAGATIGHGRAELSRLMEAGMSREQALEAMKKAGW
ncbi:MAG: hypothetical protein FJ027_23475 [Candidatus Rokubacteria bacterium]|nr:hypothetical protein [Candidatus Rokubacteria bacterium]